MDKRVKPLLQLLTLLIVGGNGWCYGVSEGWAQTETPQTAPNEIIDPATSDSVMAKTLLRQLETSVYALKDDGAKAYGLVAIAASYLVFSEESTATEHLTQALNLLDTIPDQSIKSAVVASVVAATNQLSEENLAGDLIARALAQ